MGKEPTYPQFHASRFSVFCQELLVLGHSNVSPYVLGTSFFDKASKCVCVTATVGICWAFGASSSWMTSCSHSFKHDRTQQWIIACFEQTCIYLALYQAGPGVESKPNIWMQILQIQIWIHPNPYKINENLLKSIDLGIIWSKIAP